jgi:hypothetical protein
MVSRWTISIRLTGLYERVPGKDLPARRGDLVRAVGLVRRWPTRDIAGLATSSGSESTRSLDIAISGPSRTAARMLVPSSSFSGPSGGSQPRVPLIVDGGSVRLTQKTQTHGRALAGEGPESKLPAMRWTGFGRVTLRHSALTARGRSEAGMHRLWIKIRAPAEAISAGQLRLIAGAQVAYQ